MEITIIVDDYNRSWYLKETADNFKLAKEILDTVEKGHNKMIELLEIKDDHIAGEVAEREEQEHKEYLSKTNERE